MLGNPLGSSRLILVGLGKLRFLQVKTLAVRGLEELFFQLCCCVIFLVQTGNRFWFYILTYLEYNTAVAFVVLVFWF